MSSLFSSKEKFLVFGDLHANSSQFAIACEEAGADGVVLHLNQDSTNGARFGGLEIEGDSIKEILSTVKIPVGLTIGDGRVLLADEWESAVGLGFAFVNMFAHHMPSFVWQDNRIAKIVSIGPGYILEQVKAISEFESTRALVAALTPAQGHGLPLTLLDITTLGLITKLSSKPVLVPTQRSIRPEDISLLKNQKCQGLLATGLSYVDSVVGWKEQITKYMNETRKNVQPPYTQSFTNLS